jgi:hypothetical protein
MAEIKITSGPAPVTAAKPVAAPPSAVAVKPAPAAIPATAPTTAPAQKPAASFQNIFTKTTQAVAGPKMIESIVAGKNAIGDKLKPILGSAPQLQKTLEQEKEYRQKKTQKNWQIIFAVVLLLGLGSAGYFYSELSPSFTLLGQNTTVKLGLVNDNLRSLQTKINKYRYLMAQTSLNSFSYVAEQYLATGEKLSDPNITSTNKAELVAKLSELETQIPSILNDLRQTLLPEIVYKTVVPEGQPELTDEEVRAMYESDLRTALQEEKAALIASSTNGSQENQGDIRLIDNALKLVGNNTLLGTIKGLSIDNLTKDLESYKVAFDPILRKQIQTTFKNILASTSSDIAVIASLKAARINWSTLLKQVAEETNKVDPNFNVDSFRNDLINVAGGINYSSLEFDAASNKISVSGTTFTTDGMNFTTISDLIDTFESSAYFKDVEMRSFSKAGDAQKGYSSNFNFALSLENPDEAQNGTSPTISLGRNSLKERIGFKRIKK